MSNYDRFAEVYDRLMDDVDYKARTDYLLSLFEKHDRRPTLLLDLACGTGGFSNEFAKRGADVIGVDISEEMLASARQNSAECKTDVLYLCQPAEELDLYGTVDAAVCCLDSLNYLTDPKDVQRTLRRLHLFVAPGGMLVFDVNTAAKLAALDGQVFLDETEDTYCVWRTEYRRGLCTYYVDLFRQQGDGAWDRELEIHRQRAYTVEELTGFLRQAGFLGIKVYGDKKMRAPRPGEQRVFFVARKDKRSKINGR